MRHHVILLLSLSLCVSFSGRAWGLEGRRSTKIPRFDAAVDRALTYLHEEVGKKAHRGGEQILIAYAFFKSGVPATDPFVAGALAAVVGRCGPSGYSPVGSYDHIYGAGVDSMLLSDVNAEQYKPQLQAIANYVQSVQRGDGSWSDSPTAPGDVSMSQYGILALWACQRAGCTVNPQNVDRGGDFLMKRGNPDGGWGYRPGTTQGPGAGASTHNMTMAATGSLGVVRVLLHGPPKPDKPKNDEKNELFGGVLTKEDPEAEAAAGSVFPDYKAQNSAGALDDRIRRGLSWNQQRFQPISRVEHNLYFYYCIERAFAIGETDENAAWYTTYGDGLLQLQAESGAFPTFSGPEVGTAFALLYYMRSTRQILDKQFGKGLLASKKGNPFGEKEKKREPSELDLLLASMENIDFSSLDEKDEDIADEIVRSVQAIDDPKELIGETERLTKLVKHPNWEVRRPVYWALGRTGDFKLIPLMLNGLRDPNVDVNIEAEMALRYIARRPEGFGASLNPLTGLKPDATPEERLRVANDWRIKTFKAWSNWYKTIRPFEEQSSFDELEAASFSGSPQEKK